MTMIMTAAQTAPHTNEPPLNMSSEQQTCECSDRCVSQCAAYGKVCPCGAKAAGRAAHEKMGRILCESKLFADGEPSFRRVNQAQVEMGEKLGEGGFSLVNACTWKDDPQSPKMAIKYLKRQVMVDRKTFEYGASDLANEAFFLARLHHPNIISLHAVTEGSVETNVSSGKDAGFFIIVDRLEETLDQRMSKWQAQAEAVPHSLFYRMTRECKEKQRLLLKDRVTIGLEIAKVMDYLHKQNVLLRDLKPDNIGFDSEGTLKIFDFGLAREEKLCDLVGDGYKYKMSGHTGSRRYMAPEVAKDLPYDRSVDVYSFGIILWEMCTLEKPFAGYSSIKHMKDVVIGGERPKMDSSHVAHWPVDLQWLMKSCWQSESESRPTFSIVVETLQHVLEELQTPTSDRVRARSEGSAPHPTKDLSSSLDPSMSPTRRSPRSWKVGRLISRS